MGKQTGLWRRIVLFVFISFFLTGCRQTAVEPTPIEETESDPIASPTSVPPSPTAIPPNTAVAPTPISSSAPAQLIQPPDLTYLGAFRLPEGSGGSNWEYSGYAMTFYPDGDPDGPDDGFPGSLFAVGHDHHQLVSEISIPMPILSPDKNPADLNTAVTL